MVQRFVLLMILAGILLSGCVKDPSGADDEKEVKLSGAFIINEGNFMSGNGSLSFYSHTDGTIQNQIFKSINSRDLGDVVQSMTIIDTLGFIVVNNSNKIEVISTNSWKSTTTIEMPAGASPRYVAYDESFAYVTNMFTNNVSVLDLKDYQIKSEIAVGANPDMIVISEGMAYVANSGFGWSNTVSVIDLEQKLVVKTLNVGDNPQNLVVTDNDEVLVLCGGRWPAWGDTTDTGTDGGLYVIDAISNSVVDSMSIAGHPSRLAYDGVSTAYFLNNGYLVSYSTESHAKINDTFISGYFYGLSVDPVSKNIFVTDASGFTQNGALKVYNPEGVIQEVHETKIGPGNITFQYEQE